MDGLLIVSISVTVLTVHTSARGVVSYLQGGDCRVDVPLSRSPILTVSVSPSLQHFGMCLYVLYGGGGVST